MFEALKSAKKLREISENVRNNNVESNVQRIIHGLNTRSALGVMQFSDAIIGIREHPTYTIFIDTLRKKGYTVTLLGENIIISWDSDIPDPELKNGKL